MTLIVASARFSESLMAADRRISDVCGKGIDDEAYKILYFINNEQAYSTAVGYAGLAQVGTWKMISWLMETLPMAMSPSTSLGWGIENMKTACNEQLVPLLNQVPPAHRGITIVMSGRYTQVHRITKHVRSAPFLGLISNSVGDRGRQLPEPSEVFKAHSAWPPRPSTGVSVCRGDLVAAGIATKQLRSLFRYMRRRVPYPAKVELALQFIRAVASHTNCISDNVLALVIPNEGPTEGFDFTLSTGRQVKTLPPMVYASGARVVDFRVSPL